jgi:hypothetical protein
MSTEWYTWPFSEEQLFGSEGGIETTSTMSPQQQKLMKQLYPYLSERIGQGLPAWEGDWTVPISEEEQYGLGQYKEAISGLTPGETQDWYNKYIAPGELSYMRKTIVPGIKESMVGGGLLRSTDTGKQVGEAWTAFGEGQLGRMGEAIMSERERATSALPGYMEAASLKRTIEQEDLNRRINEFVRTTPELSPILNTVMQYLGIDTTAAYYNPGQEGLLATLAPAAAQAIGSYYGAQV